MLHGIFLKSGLLFSDYKSNLYSSEKKNWEKNAESTKKQNHPYSQAGMTTAINIGIYVYIF